MIHRRDLAIAGLGSEVGQDLTLEEVLELYLEDLRARVSEQHFKNVDMRLRHIVELLEGKRVRDLKPMDVIRIRNQAQQDGAAHRTSNLLVDRLRTMLRWATENEIIAHSPIDRVRKLPETADHQRYKRRALSDEEIERFLSASRADDEENELRAGLEGMVRVPQTPMWTAFLETGARWNELRQATWGDLDLAQRFLVLRAESTKSKKQRTIPLRKELVDQLVELRALHESVLRRLPNISDRIFLTPEGMQWAKPTTNAMRIFDRLLERAGIAKVDTQGRKLDIHALRHTCNSRLARMGVGIDKRQHLLGHSDPKLTAQVYTHLDADDLRDAIEVYPRCVTSVKLRMQRSRGVVFNRAERMLHEQR